MKVWTKNKRYKIEKIEDGWIKVYSGDRQIATVVDEESARQAIWLAVGGKEYVNKEDFEEVGND